MNYISTFYKFAMDNIADNFNSDLNEVALPFSVWAYDINDISVASAFNSAYNHVLRFDAEKLYWVCRDGIDGNLAAEACMHRLIVELRKKAMNIMRGNDYSVVWKSHAQRILRDLPLYENQNGRDRALQTAAPLMACTAREVKALNWGVD